MPNAVGNKLNISRTFVKCRGIPIYVCMCACVSVHIYIYLAGEHRILSSSQSKLLNQ